MAKLTKGMNRDLNPIDQEPGTYRYGRNIVVNEVVGAITNEKGTRTYSVLPSGAQIVGSIFVGERLNTVADPTRPGIEVILFVIYASGNTNVSEIARITPTGEYISIINDVANTAKNKWNWTTQRPIEGEYKIDATGNITIYWTDDYNKPSFLDLQNLPSTPFLLSEISVFPQLDHLPLIELDEVNSTGGNLSTGAYQLSIALATDDGARTSFVNISNVVYINDEAEELAEGQAFAWSNGNYQKMDYDGHAPNGPSSKVIIFKVSNLDPQYTKIVPAVVRTIGGAQDAVILPTVSYSSPIGTPAEKLIVVTGSESATAVSLAEIGLANQVYTKAKTVTQVDDVLYWGNLEREKPDIGYQQYANSIEVVAKGANDNGNYCCDTTIKPILVNGSYRNFRLNHNFGATAMDNYYLKGYRRDETYAFYISWVMKDGTESVAYHIPGRPAGNKSPKNVADFGKTPTSWVNSGGTAIFEDEDITEDLFNGGVSHPFNSERSFLPGTPFYKIDNGTYTNGQLYNNMLFWQNENEFYPDKDEFDIWTCDANTGQPVPVCVQGKGGHPGWRTAHTLRNKNVRHHHFPSEMTGGAQGRWAISGSVYQHGPWGDNASDFWGNNKFNPLGFELKNIPIPGEDLTFAPGTTNDQYYQGKGIRDKVIGYKIYYATRSRKDMTILDSGLIHGHTVTQGQYADAPRGVKWFPTVNQSTFSGAFDTSINNFGTVGQGDSPHSAAHHSMFHCTERDSRFFTMQPLDTIINKHSIQGVSLIKGTAWCSPWNPQKGAQETTSSYHGNRSGRYHGVIRYEKTLDQESIMSRAESHMLYDLGIQRVTMHKANVTTWDDATGNITNEAAQYSLLNSYISLQGKTYLPAGILYNSVGGFTYGIDNLQGSEALAFEANTNVGFAKWHGGDTAQEAWDLSGIGHVATFADVVFNGNFRIYHACTTSQASTWHGLASYAIQPGNCNTGQTGNPPQYYFGNNLDTNPPGTYYQGLGRYSCLYGNLAALPTDIYNSFLRQIDLTYTGHAEALPATIPNTNGYMISSSPHIFGGDTYLGYASHKAYKKSEAVDDQGNNYMAGHPLNSKDVGYGTWPRQGNNNTGNAAFKDNYFDYATHLYIVESGINPYLRHADLGTEAFYPEYAPNATEMTDHQDPYTLQGAYNNDYSQLNNFKNLLIADPYNPLLQLEDFPTRMIRSVKFNRSGIIDNFRVYLPEQYRDLPRNRGELWVLKSYNNVVVPHLERAITLTKGKETLQLSSVSEAFVGTGDLFENDPAESLHTDTGYAGTQSQWAGVVSQWGYFFIDKDARKVFLLGDKIEEISMYGMRQWFLDNCRIFSLPNSNQRFDMPTAGLGYLATYDPEEKRFLLTKRNYTPSTEVLANGDWATIVNKIIWDDETSEFVVTTAFTLSGECSVCSYSVNDTFGFDNVDIFQEDNWTLSYYPDRKSWVSFHDYYPSWYISSLNRFYSYQNHTLSGTNTLESHDSNEARGFFPTTTNSNGQFFDFEIEFIDNASPTESKLYSSFRYTMEQYNATNNSPIYNPGFNNYFVYNTHQMSDVMSIDFAPGVNGTARRLDRDWVINNFRDDSIGFNNTNPQFIEDSDIINPNPNYINNTKIWSQRRKFIDNWVGIRLIGTNNTNKLVSLYSVDSSKRKTYR